MKFNCVNNNCLNIILDGICATLCRRIETKEFTETDTLPSVWTVGTVMESVSTLQADDGVANENSVNEVDRSNEGSITDDTSATVVQDCVVEESLTGKEVFNKARRKSVSDKDDVSITPKKILRI